MSDTPNSQRNFERMMRIGLEIKGYFTFDDVYNPLLFYAAKPHVIPFVT
jgi:hypothetical protein